MSSTVEATLLMLAAMPGEMQEKVYEYTSRLFTVGQGEHSPFTAMSEQQILSFLEKSHNQTVCGEIVEAHAALEEIGMQHEFL